MKLFKIIVLSKDSEDFEMQVTASDNILFSDLHQGIQSALEYDPLQMASFFLSNEDWDKETEIALVEMEETNEQLLMDETKLSDKIVTINQKLIYLYDFFSERIFLMNVESIEETDSKIFDIKVNGEIPMQIDIDSDGIDSIIGDMGSSASKDEFDAEFDDNFSDDFTMENIDDLEDY